MKHVKGKKTLDFVANARLSRMQADGDIVCELPVIKGGQAVFPCVLSSSVVSFAHTNCFVVAQI